MKDLTHYFNSPSPLSKKPEASPTENENLAEEKTPKMNKKVRKKRLKLDKLTPPEAEDNKQQGVVVLDVGAEIVVETETVNGDSSVADNEVRSGTGCDTGSERKKKKRKLSPSCEDTSKRTKRKVAKGRLKIINIPSNSPDSLNSSQPSDSSLARDILVNSLVVDKLSSLVGDNEDFNDDDGYEIEDDSDEDEDYNSKKVKRKKKKRKSAKRTSVENGGVSSETVSTPLRNGTESSEMMIEVEPVSEKRNSLFMYYSKVDKNVQNNERMSEKIKVQALVHTPPSEKRRSSSNLNNTPSSSAKSTLRKKFGRLQRELMKASDNIEIVSSEEIVQSQTSELLLNGDCDTLSQNVSSNCDTLLSSKKCVTAELETRAFNDLKIKINSKLAKSDSVNTEDELRNENESPNSNAKTASNTLSKEDSNKVLSEKRLRKPNPKYSDTVDESEKPSETAKKKVKNVKKQLKMKISPPCSVVDLDESSNDSVCEARVVRESTTNRNSNKSAKIILNDKSAGLMAKFLGKSLVSSPKETVSKIVKVDPSVLIARQKFLKSGLPDDFRQKIASQIEEVIAAPPPFPSVSHIQQRDPMRLIWNIPEPQLKLGPSPTVDLELSPDWQTLFPDSQNVSSSELSDNAGEPIKKIKNKSFIKDFLRTKANTQLAINERWTLMKKLKSEGVVSACWTDIYKPKSSGDILGNKSCVERFKVWLETYKNTAVKPTGDEGSSDEFIHSSDESSSMPNERICIISGPVGCGKTSTVYAVAQELGYKVLEVNASHNRNGKKVTADLSEATQSHQVEHGSLKDIFSNGRKVKKKKTKNKASSNDVSSKKKSLILVEDADLLFEGFDEGFIPAIAALSLTSKRPMVFTVNNKKAQHFSKFVKPSDLMLEFHRPTSSILASWLQLIAMAEGIHLDDSHADLLANWSNNDIRKSLVQLQFLAQSCEDTAKWPSYIDRIRFPSAIMKGDSTKVEDVLNKNDLTASSINKSDDVTTGNDVITPSVSKLDDVTRTSKSEMIASLRSLARRSDSLVVSDLLMTSLQEASDRSRDPCPRPEVCVCRDSTALSENAAPLARSSGRQTNCFVETLLKHVGLCVASDVRCPRKRWKSDNNLKTALPLMVRCSHSTIYSDYLPTLRFFGQCEDLRLSAYTRRNRNFNYLQGLGVNTSDGLTFDAFL